MTAVTITETELRILLRSAYTLGWDAARDHDAAFEAGRAARALISLHRYNSSITAVPKRRSFMQRIRYLFTIRRA